MHTTGWKSLVGVAALAAAAAAAHGQLTVAQWNFNSSLADSNVGTGVITPSVRYGAAALVGGAIASFASGDSGSGSTDPASGDDSGWQLTNFPAQGTGSGTCGATFAVSTVGFASVSIMFDLRASSTSSRYWQVFYSTDGVNFLPSTVFSASSGGERWYNQQTVDLSLDTTVNNNPNFKFRVAPVLDPLLQTAYSAAGAVSAYDPAGAYRLDMVTVLGQPTGPAQPSGVATVNPPAVCSGGGQVRLQVAVTRGQNPNSSSLAVRANLSTLGGSATQSLLDNGLNGDLIPNDSVYSLLYTVPAGQAVGVRTIPITISDSQGRVASPFATLTVAACDQNAASRVVISQVYGGGGNTPPPASVYNADFVELYNRSGQPVDLAGWSVQYAPPFESGGFTDAREKLDLSGVIQPGQYLLLLYTVPNSIGAPLPTPDFVLPARVGVGHTGGRVALVRSTALVGDLCAAPLMEDLVGYGLAATCFEGAAPSGTVDNNTAAVRKLGGSQDTNQSFNDFSVATPTPHNRSAGGFLAGYGSWSDLGVCAGQSATISVSVVPATGAPGPSTGITVLADLTAVGGPAAAVLTDAGGSVFTLAYTMPVSIAAGRKVIPVSVSDAQGRSDHSTTWITVGSCTPSASRVVISQVFAGGGNNLAAFNADFVELFNRSGQPVDLQGWSLQYARADDPSGFVGAPDLLTLTGVMAPGQYLLVQTGAASATQGVPIPAPDFLASPSFGIDNEFGRVALARTTAPLGAVCSGSLIEDLVGYGVTAICYEGAGATDKLTNSRVLLRRQGGCQDFDQSIIDWSVVDGTTTFPHNSLSLAAPCIVAPVTGACCTGSTCSILTSAGCSGPHTVFVGTGTVCNTPGNPTSPCCIADFNHAGGVTVQDIFDFLLAYFAADPKADFNGIGGVTVQDIFDFLTAYFAGCV